MDERLVKIITEEMSRVNKDPEEVYLAIAEFLATAISKEYVRKDSVELDEGKLLEAFRNFKYVKQRGKRGESVHTKWIKQLAHAIATNREVIKK